MSRLGQARPAGGVKPALDPKEMRRVQTTDQVPTVCPWCSCQWRRIPGGVSCFSCGRDIHVTALLGEIIERREDPIL